MICVTANKVACRGGTNFALVLKYIHGAINRPSPAPLSLSRGEQARTGLNYRFDRISGGHIVAEQIPRGKRTCFLSRKGRTEQEMPLETLSAAGLGRSLSPGPFHKDATAGSVGGWLQEREGRPALMPRVQGQGALCTQCKSQLIRGMVISCIRFFILTSLNPSTQHPSSTVGKENTSLFKGPHSGKFSTHDVGTPSVSGYQTLTAKHQRRPLRTLAAM